MGGAALPAPQGAARPGPSAGRWPALASPGAQAVAARPSGWGLRGVEAPHDPMKDPRSIRLPQRSMRGMPARALVPLLIAWLGRAGLALAGPSALAPPARSGGASPDAGAPGAGRGVGRGPAAADRAVHDGRDPAARAAVLRGPGGCPAAPPAALPADPLAARHPAGRLRDAGGAHAHRGGARFPPRRARGQAPPGPGRSHGWVRPVAAEAPWAHRRAKLCLARAGLHVEAASPAAGPGSRPLPCGPLGQPTTSAHRLARLGARLAAEHSWVLRSLRSEERSVHEGTPLLRPRPGAVARSLQGASP